jgi:hypothetical protein
VFKTPSANIAVALNKLNKLPESPALDAVKAYLKAATVQSTRGVHLLHRCPPPEVIANEAPGNKEVLIFTRATT